MIRLWLAAVGLILVAGAAGGLAPALVVVAGGLADGLRLVGAGIGAALLAGVGVAGLLLRAVPQPPRPPVLFEDDVWYYPALPPGVVVDADWREIDAEG